MASKRYERNRNINKGSSYYAYGNVAYDIQPEYTPYYPNAAEEQHRIAEEKARKLENRESRITAFKFIVIIVLLFAGSIVFMGMNVRVANERVELRKEKNQLADLKASNAILQAELTEKIDLDYIKEQATTRLGMAEPQPYQIVYIDVPKQSYTVQYAADAAKEEKKSGFLKFTSRFKKD